MKSMLLNGLFAAPTWAVFRRELKSYFATPVAYVFIVIFLVLAGAFTFYLGGFYERGQADLQPFFSFHPWLYLFLVPAVSMRLWAEERKSGTIELLLSLPVTMGQAVMGKFLAAWAFIGIALALTFPIWLTVNYLGDPDNGVILASYLGSGLMAGAFLAVGACLSAATRNQVIAFILTAAVCFLFLLAGFPMVLDFFRVLFPQIIVDAVANLSFLTHFAAIAKGVLDLRDVLFFLLSIAFWLYASAVVIDLKKAD
jgi:ABC-2 type transport system permease protein